MGKRTCRLFSEKNHAVINIEAKAVSDSRYPTAADQFPLQKSMKKYGMFRFWHMHVSACKFLVYIFVSLAKRNGFLHSEMLAHLVVVMLDHNVANSTEPVLLPVFAAYHFMPYHFLPYMPYVSVNSTSVYLLIIDHPPFKPYFAQILTWTFLQTG